jgi:hypothetical protein
MGSPGKNLHQTPEVVNKVLKISFLSKLLKRFPLQGVNGDIYMMNVNTAQPLEVLAAELCRKIRSKKNLVPVFRGNSFQERDKQRMKGRFEKAGYEKVATIDPGNEGEEFFKSGFLHESVAPDPGKIVDAKGTPEIAITGDVGGDEFVSQRRKAFFRLHKGLENFSPCFYQVFRLHNYLTRNFVTIF